MQIPFYKYQGTGNDFVMIDNREGLYSGLTAPQVKAICDRRMGIGADGLILLERTSGFDFKMVYYNADGNVSSMCGNGGRCIVMFAKQLGIIENKTIFLAADGVHRAIIKKQEVQLHMRDVLSLRKYHEAFVLDTGSPHFVKFEDELDHLAVKNKGHAIRYSAKFKKEGINVNFVQIRSRDIYVRTYERGVEDETLSCGTGCTASAIALHAATMGIPGDFIIPITTPGGQLKVHFKFEEKEYRHVVLEGPAQKVFEGIYILNN